MNGMTRREFVKTSAAALAAGAAALPGVARGAYAGGRGEIRVGVIGCGGRGTGAATDLLTASPDAVVVAMADAFGDRLDGSLSSLRENREVGPRVRVPDDARFTGLDAYQKLLATDVDVVILATPPGFRPIHMSAAVDAGKHVFMEKPVAVDPWGVRTVLDAARKAKEKRLNIVTGTQRRHEQCYLEAMRRIQDGAIGRVVGAAVYWNQGGLWMHKHSDHADWSDTQWQLRNWLYFTWLSGDHITEQHVHNLDVAHWAVGRTPVRCLGMGGRQVRTAQDYGNIFDHFAVQFEYEDGVQVSSQCRQIDGCSGRVEEVILGTEGQAILASGRAQIKGPKAWRFDSQQENPYVSEHRALVAGITGGEYINEGERVAHSTLMAIMGRESAYTGKTLTWEKVLASEERLMPEALDLAGALATPAVAVPGKA